MLRALCRSEVLAKERIERERGGRGMQFCSRADPLVCQDDDGGAAGMEERLVGWAGRASARAAASSRGRVGEGKGTEGNARKGFLKG